jgi:hypothetical protein
VDASGNPFILPTLIPTVTPNVTATPYVTPTLYPTVTLGVSVSPPNGLCGDKEDWIQTICRQSWIYLGSNEQGRLITAISTIGTSFLALDTWWLQNIRRGIMDVPPQIWQTDSLRQCAGNTTCSGIVHDSNFLFENMWRIGVDWANLGYGQALNINGVPDLTQQQLWFLPPFDFSQQQLEQYWGWVQGTDYACETLRSPFAPLNGFDALADVCWVCQDVPTVLYERQGFSLKNIMPNYISGYNEAYYRNVPGVVDFASNYASSFMLSGGDPNYRIGEMVFTSISPIQYGYFASYNHVAIVVRGAEPNMSFEQALDYVLVAQISYSSQGFFSSSFQAGSLALSPQGSGGRYEVITLRTYLLKHLLGAMPQPVISNVMDINELLNGASLYLRHWAPSEIHPDR